MIDFEITVDVSRMTKDQREEVQQLFHDLGLDWEQPNARDKFTEAAFYSNKDWESNISKHMKWWARGTGLAATHLVGELRELRDNLVQVEVGKNGKPFDLEKALTGEPVETRGGMKVTQLTLFGTNSEYKLAGVVGGDLYRFTEEGVYIVNQVTDLDLVMKVKTHTLNGFEVPAPVTNPENMKGGVTYFVADATDSGWYFQTTWANDDMDIQWVERNLVFLDADDAIANAKAMSGVNPYGGCNE